MKNKYKEELSKYKVSNKVKESIYNKLEQPKIKRFKVSYGVIALILTCIISVGIVYAKDIKEFIESWGKTKVTFYQKEGKQSEAELESVNTIKTKLDNYVFEEEMYNKILKYNEDNYESLHYCNGFSPEGLNDISYFSNQKIEEINEKLGVDILGFSNLDYEYYYDEITNERKIGSITIRSKDYILSCTKTNGECNKVRPGYKGFNITAKLSTKNSQKAYHEMNEYNYIYDFSDNNYDTNIKEFNKIGNINVKGISYQIPVENNDGTINEFAVEMYFNHNNIRYNISGWNLTHEEIIKILKENLK